MNPIRRPLAEARMTLLHWRLVRRGLLTNRLPRPAVPVVRYGHANPFLSVEAAGGASKDTAPVPARRGVPNPSPSGDPAG